MNIDNASNVPPAGSLDSINLGQLRAIMETVPKPKQWWYDYNYDDEDTVMNEIDELYSYVEMPQVAENLKAWKGSFTGEWTKSAVQQRKIHIELLLEGLEHRTSLIRFTNARRLFYVVQGTFAETVSPEHQLHWIFENCKLVRAANGVSTIVNALVIASSKHDFICGLSDDAISPDEKNEVLEEIITEISVYFGMLYHLIEVFKGHDDFADELMSLDPPLPVYLFNVVSGLRDKSAKGYPIKKLLLLLWKSLLACWGGIRDHARVKKLARELAGLRNSGPGSEEPDRPDIKSSPLDIEAFRQETSVKYPTFVAPSEPLSPTPIRVATPAALTAKLSQAYSPIPVRHHYDHGSDNQVNPQGMSFHSSQQQSFRPNPQPATPAPYPPPGPKPKKQQYQTDQTRPFLFPFSRSTTGNNPPLIPFAIDEADRLYNRHMYISLSLLQMWKTREDCMTYESGLDHMPGSEGEFQSSTFVKDPETSEPLPDVAFLDGKIEEMNSIIGNAKNVNERRKAKERKEDLMRLKRVEQIYSAILNVGSNCVLVLLKLLLATVSASTSMQGPASATSVFPIGGASPQEPQPVTPPLTLDEIDVIRHREINTKAASAIILLTLKWFKVSHVMKFHHFGQMLLDTNCLLLIMKMFGLQEVTASVSSMTDSPDNNFFRYCLLNFSQNPQQVRPEDQMLKPPRHFVVKTTRLPNGEDHTEEVEMVTDYSWRNFFSTINFAKVMQKLSKGRSHRIFLLVQYKSTAVLKRLLRIQQPMLQLHLLKLIKSQVPFSGRKWRQTNMKVITAIYLNCRPDLRDEWLTGTEIEDASDAMAQETALRHLVKFYNTKRYETNGQPPQYRQPHRRSGSVSQQLEGLHPGPELSGIIRSTGTPNIVDADVFPPARSQAPDTSIFLPYIPEDLIFEEEYEEYLSDLGWSDEGKEGSSFSGVSAWHRFPAEFAADMADGISDSESIASIGELGDDVRLLDPTQGAVDENLNNWEHMSPKTMAALPKSPAGHRRSNSGSGLRPVIPLGLDDSSAVDLEDDEIPEMGPAPREGTAPFASGAGVDEVEYAYGV